MMQPEPEPNPEDTDVTEWTGSTVRSRDGSKLGTLIGVLPGRGAGGRWGVIRSKRGRQRLVPLDGAADDGIGDLSIEADAEDVRAAPVLVDPAPADPEATAVLATGDLHRHYTGRRTLADARALQHERYGGSKLGSAFFGWLVAVGVTVLLGVLAGVVTAAVGGDGTRAGALVTVAVLVVGYFVGGYVAGRLARFDGARNGFLTWVVGVLATGALAVLAAFVGAQYDVLSRVQLPTLPAAFGQVTVSNLVLLAVAITGTLVAAVLGGRVGEGFHRRVDRAATDAL
jgi:uncharacterized membrane protein YeaQ/YmgE (transglycosylase-associated protein family)